MRNLRKNATHSWQNLETILQELFDRLPYTTYFYSLITLTFSSVEHYRSSVKRTFHIPLYILQDTAFCLASRSYGVINKSENNLTRLKLSQGNTLVHVFHTSASSLPKPQPLPMHIYKQHACPDPRMISVNRLKTRNYTALPHCRGVINTC
jgi:hypothetical protein